MFKFSLKQLEYFAKVAESGSFAVAARELHISQPSISSAIYKLENALNVQLFVRHHAQGVSLTSAGGRILVEARDLLAHTDDFRQNALGLGEQMQGRLHIGCFGPIASMYLPAIVTQFFKLYPGVDLKLYEENTEALIAGLEGNRYDIAIVYKLDVPPALKLESLVSLRPYVILPTDHPLVGKSAIPLKQLAKYPMVSLDLPRSREYFSALFESKGLNPPISMRSPSFETVRALVANGAGFSVLVTRPHHNMSYDGNHVVEREIKDIIPSMDIVIVRHGKTRPTRLLTAFVDHCNNHFSDFEQCARQPST